MKTKNLFIFSFLSFSLLSCSTMTESISFGAGTGALTGAGASLMLSKKGGKAATTSAAIGAVVGGIASYFIHGSLKKRDAKIRKKTLFNLEKFDVYQGSRNLKSNSNTPFSVSPARVEQDYIETHIQDGKRLIEGHRVWTISEDSQWIPSQIKKTK